MYGRMVERGLVDSTWHCASEHCFVIATLLLVGFASFEETSFQNIWNSGRTRTCWFTVTVCLCALLCQCSNFDPQKYVCGLTPSLFAWLVSSKFFHVSGNQIAATSKIFPVCPLHTRKIADGPTCHSKKSVAVVLPALAKTLDAMNKQEMGQWQLTKLSLYSVTDLVQELLDISSYLVSVQIMYLFLCNSPASCYSFLGTIIPQHVSDHSFPVLYFQCDRQGVTFVPKSPKNHNFV